VSNLLYIQKFLYYKATRSPTTVAFYRSGLSHYAGFAGDAWPPTPELVTGFIDICKERKYAKNSIHAYFRVVRAWCNWLARSGVIQVNPIPLVDAPRQPGRKIPRAPHDETLCRFFRFLEERVEEALRLNCLAERWEHGRDLAIYSLIFDTGLRAGEVVALDCDDVDLEGRTVLVRESKAGTQRIVPFGAYTKGDLVLWTGVRKRLPVRGCVRSFFVRRSRCGEFKPLTYWSIHERLERLCRAACVDDFSPHALRHAYANQSLMNGASLEDLRENMGHSSLKTTSIYTLMHIEQRRQRSLRTSPRSNQGRK
jgi:integrase/recombinase XerC